MVAIRDSKVIVIANTSVEELFQQGHFLSLYEYLYSVFVVYVNIHHHVFRT